jgi:hypothetical protein
MKINKIIRTFLAGLALAGAGSCNDYVDIIPDNVATMEYAFRMKSMAERYLFTCYSYMPLHGDYAYDIGFLGGDEVWNQAGGESFVPSSIAWGNQTKTSPRMNFWEGTNYGKNLYQAIRNCNIFMENIYSVPDMLDDEKDRWYAEAKFLKAYYHFYLVRMYGPIVIVRDNLPVSVSPDEARVPRSPVDECCDYIVQLLDEAIAEGLPDYIADRAQELGRATKAIALTLKAKTLVLAASPLFNGNADYTGFTNNDGTQLISTVYDATKWDKAARACKEAIDFCHAQGVELYYYNPRDSKFDLSDTIITQLSIRQAICEPFNIETIWGSTIYWCDAARTQGMNTPRGLDASWTGNTITRGAVGPPMKIVEIFYSENGVPITEDKTWPYADRFVLRQSDASNRLYIKEGYTTAQLNFNREPRYYADLGFDGSIYYGLGVFDDKADNLVYYQGKLGQPGLAAAQRSISGYYAKKVVHFENTITNSAYTTINYPWPEYRLSDLYLLYAETLNESQGPSDEIYNYLNPIRARAGLPTVQEAWTKFSTNPDKYRNKDGLREIIHQERLIELAFEFNRLWDLRRWKKAVEEQNKPITGWDILNSSAEQYYREKTIFSPTFYTRDYLWPLSEKVLLTNPNLVQNPGW